MADGFSFEDAQGGTDTATVAAPAGDQFSFEEAQKPSVSPSDNFSFEDASGVTSGKSDIPETDKAYKYPQQLGNPPGAVVPDWLKNFDTAAGEMIKGIPSMPGQMLKGAVQLHQVIEGMPQERNQALAGILKEAIPQAQQFTKDLHAPVGSHEWWRGALQVGMMAAPALEFLKVSPKVTPEVPVIEKPPVQPGTIASDVSKAMKESDLVSIGTDLEGRRGGEADASTITGAESVPEHEVRTQVGEETPLRQSGETTGAQEQEPVSPGQPVAPPVQAQPNAPGTGAGAVETGGPSIRAVSGRPITAPPPGTIRGWEDATKHGENWLDQGGNINKVVTDFQKSGKVNELEMGKMNAYLKRLQAVTNVAGDALRKAPNDPALQKAYQEAVDREEQFTGAYKPMHTVASGALGALKGKVPLDPQAAASFTGLARRFREFRGKEMEPGEVMKAERLSRQQEKANGEYANGNGEHYKTLDREYSKVKPSRARKGPPTLEDLAKTFGEKLDEVCDL